jgi:hypothetical protein
MPQAMTDAPTPASVPVPGTLVLDMQKHGICFVVPLGALVEGDFSIPGGALIYGKMRGRIMCHEGSLILAPGSDFAGKAEASQIYINGVVRPITSDKVSEFKGNMLIAVSQEAQGRANLTSRMFAIHSRKFAGNLTTIDT